MKSVRTILFENKSDERFRAFTASLLPTVKNEAVIGVPQPVLRRIAKALLKECEPSNARGTFGDGGGACGDKGYSGCRNSAERKSFCESGSSCGCRSSAERESFRAGSVSCAGGSSSGREPFREGGVSYAGECSAEREASRERAAEISAFMRELPHEFYEEQMLHGLFIEAGRGFGRVCAELDEFLPFVDNWATCDAIRPKVFAQNLGALLLRIEKWLQSGRTYEIRFGVKMLMDFYLDEAFKVEYAQRVAEIVSDEYYVNMMLAWYFATALAKQYDAVLPFLEQRRLGAWVHNKTIQKAVESRRIRPERKAVLRQLRQRQPYV